MRRILTITATAVVLFWFVGCTLSRYFASISADHNRQAEAALFMFVNELGKYHGHNGTYPPTLSDLEAYEEIDSKYLRGGNASEFSYHLQGSNYRIYYYQQPMGPFHGFSSEKDDYEYHE